MSSKLATRPPAQESDSLRKLVEHLPRTTKEAAPRLKLLSQLIQSESIDDEAALVAQFDWRTWWARENQLPPSLSQSGGDWHIWLGLAGRGFGKTRMGVEWFLEKVAEGTPDVPLAIIGRTAADVRDVLIEGPTGIMARSPPWRRPNYEPSKRRITWSNGVYATTFTAEEPDQMRGPQFGAALADEIAAWPYFEDAWSNLLLATRLGPSPQIAALTTPRPLPQIRELLSDPDVAITRGATFDNIANLSPKFIVQMRKRYEGTRLGKQELYGELLDDLPGALWTHEVLERCLAKPGETFTPDMFSRIVIAVDPSGSSGDDEGDPQGIIAAGELRDRPEHYVVLQDRTERRSPEGWAGESVRLFDELGADLILGEKNYGGDMVRAVIQGYRPSAPVKLISASRGKHLRAEPVSMLYEQGKVTHVAGLGALEDEYRNFTTQGYKGGASPNRADAAVWCLLELAKGALNEPRIRSL